MQLRNRFKCDLLCACICPVPGVGDATGGAVLSVGDTGVPGLTQSTLYSELFI
jgi:hypothetical protein